MERISSHVDSLMARVKLKLPSSDAKTLALIYENGLVTKKEYIDGDVYIEAEVPKRVKELLDKIA